MHIRTHRETFERNQRVKELVKRAESGLARLEELNKVITPCATEEQTPIRNPAPLPTIQPEAMHNNQNVVTAGMCVGPIPESEPIQSKYTRGGDKKKRAPCSCVRCKKWYPQWKNQCKGEGDGGAASCDLFDGAGVRRCGRCQRFNGSYAYECAAVRENVEDCEYFDENGNEIR